MFFKLFLFQKKSLYQYCICSFAYFSKIYDGSVSIGRELATFCGARTKNTQTVSNTMHIEYLISGISWDTGFLVTYSQGKYFDYVHS